MAEELAVDRVSIDGGNGALGEKPLLRGGSLMKASASAIDNWAKTGSRCVSLCREIKVRPHLGFHHPGGFETRQDQNKPRGLSLEATRQGTSRV